MKKYFAKFLPVEGEIQKGDIVMNADNSVCCYWNDKSIHNLSPVDDETISYLKNPRKAKSFLCTKEVKKNDLVRAIYKLNSSDAWSNGEYKEYQIIEKTKINGDGWKTSDENIIGATCFKVVGEISSDAKWVKEGDQFDEDEIKIGVYYPIFIRPNKIHPKRTELTYEWIETGDFDNNVEYNIKIKCSQCENFH